MLCRQILDEHRVKYEYNKGDKCIAYACTRIATCSLYVFLRKLFRSKTAYIFRVNATFLSFLPDGKMEFFKDKGGK